MKRIKLSIMGRQYPLKVEDYDEAQMYEMAEYVEQRIKHFKKDLVNQPEHLILTLTCLSIAEELFKLKQHSTQPTLPPPASYQQPGDGATDSIQRLLSEILSEIRQ
jgi:cell division protein ZapA